MKNFFTDAGDAELQYLTQANAVYCALSRPTARRSLLKDLTYKKQEAVIANKVSF